MNTQLEPTIAILSWGHTWEDFYDTVGISFESFCKEVSGGWMFGYIQALKLAGVRTVVIYPSTRVTKKTHFKHEPTGATICMLPVPKSYRAIRRHMITPYPSFAGNMEELFGDVQGSRRAFFKVLRQVAPYLTTPLGLLARELQQEGCRAILCQEYEYFRFDVCVLLGHLMRLPVFASFQGTSNDASRIGCFLRPMTIGTCAGLIISPQIEIQRVRSQYNLPPANIAQIFNPVPLGISNTSDRSQARAILNLPDDAEVVVWHGRIELQVKGLDILLDAWERICSERPGRDLRLLLMGTGKDSEKLRQRIAALPIQNVLWVDRFVNDRVEIQRFLSASDVYAFPSRVEGFPVAPIEAMACGLPVVAADASGVPDILEGGEASGGLVVPRGDATAFALALGRVLDNQEWRHELGNRARRRIEEHFSLEVVGRQLRDFFFKSGISVTKS